MRTLWIAAIAACTGPIADDVDDTSDGEDPSLTPIEAYDPLTYVDPIIGTGGLAAQIASVNPGASAPNGMTLIGPDTYGAAGEFGALHCAGYWYEDDRIRAFSVAHAHGMGVPDYGIFPFLPRDGWSSDWIGRTSRLAPFSHDTEEASAGYYAVTLDDHDVRVELTASLRGAIARMTFPDDADPTVVFPLGEMIADATVKDASGTWDAAEGELVLYQNASGSYSGRFGGLQAHAVATFDPAPTIVGGWEDPGAPTPDLADVDGATSGLWLGWPAGTETVEMRLALSYVDHDGARANLDAELDEGFDAVRAATEQAWRDRLTVARVRGGTEADLRTFHSALYKSLLMPSRQDDVDGRYRGMDQAVHTADGPHYSDLSLWDTFRTLHPMYLLLWPDLQDDVNRSMVRMIEDGGYLPKWPLAHGYTGGMVGSPAIQVLAESYLKGRGEHFDVETAYAASMTTSTTPVPKAGRGGLDNYLNLGWVTVDEDGGGSVSDTLEYAWNDHALALWAEAMGKSDDATALFAQSQAWKNHWDPSIQFMTGRKADGTFVFDDKFSWSTWFTEGNAWHYLWYAPYDPQGMVDLQAGGDLDAFLERWLTYWGDVYVETDDNLPDDYYWHGNEPVMHVAFLASLLDRPDLSSAPARWVLANRYSDQPAGLDGNDDAGTLSAWYALASMGIFPIAGTTTWAASSPIWERVEIDREGADPLVIRATGDLAGGTVEAWALGDDAIDGGTVDDADLHAAGELVFTLGPALKAPTP